MTDHSNLLRDGFERVAGYAKRAIESRRRSSVLIVRDNGRVRIEYPSKVDDEGDAPHIVGCYTPTTPIETIEGDLLLRQRELAGGAA